MQGYLSNITSSKKVILGFLVMIILFVAYKFQMLKLPFFWDEAWVYAPAVYSLKQQGLSLLPTAIDAALSRGHPLLFHNLAAAWLHLFGESITVAHSFVLVVAIALLGAFVYSAFRFSSSVVGAIVIGVLLAIQPIFLAQSGLLLPEMLLALLVFCAFVGYVFDLKAVQFLALLGALFTKESALVAVVAFVFSDSLLLLLKRISYSDYFKRMTIVLAPAILLGLFFMKQKLDLGWYFFPEHIGFIDTSTAAVLNKLERYASFVFVYQGRIAITLGILIALFFLFKNKTSLILTQQKALVFIGLFLVGFLVFSSINFYSDRYMLVLMPLLIVGFFIVLDASGMKNGLKMSLLGAIVLFQVIAGSNYKGNNDHNMSYADAVRAYQIAINNAVDKGFQAKNIYAPFLLSGALQQPVMGYVTEQSKFQNVTSVISDETQVAFFSNIDDKANYDAVSQAGSWIRIDRVEVNKAWVEIYLNQGK